MKIITCKNNGDCHIEGQHTNDISDDMINDIIINNIANDTIMQIVMYMNESGDTVDNDKFDRSHIIGKQ